LSTEKASLTRASPIGRASQIGRTWITGRILAMKTPTARVTSRAQIASTTRITISLEITSTMELHGRDQSYQQRDKVTRRSLWPTKEETTGLEMNRTGLGLPKLIFPTSSSDRFEIHCLSRYPAPFLDESSVRKY